MCVGDADQLITIYCAKAKTKACQWQVIVSD